MAIRIDTYTIDTLYAEELQLEAEVTEYPVEKGTAVSDNVRIKPRVLRLTGVVSDTPLGPVATLRSTDKDLTPRKEAELFLTALFDAGESITVTTDERTYKSMVIQSLTIPNEGVDALNFSATLKEVVIEENVRVLVKTKLTPQKKGNKAPHPPGWIGTDSKGRDIIANKLGPGVEPSYTRADGTVVSQKEAADAARKQDSVVIKYDKDGHAVPVDNADYQPYTPKQKKPYWAPTSQTDGPVIPGSIFNGGI